MANDAISMSDALDAVYNMDVSDCANAEEAVGKIYQAIGNLPNLDVAQVVHDGNTSFVSVKDVDEWQDRIILAEGDESKRCKVYYAESLALIAHLKEKIVKRDKLLAVMGVRIPEDGEVNERP